MIVCENIVGAHADARVAKQFKEIHRGSGREAGQRHHAAVGLAAFSGVDPHRTTPFAVDRASERCDGCATVGAAGAE
ncbi:hypothetical protein SDC9_184676 [bioreactor metagenome]|uniref:Uncharacterized protein n=1 Tax=bioreactor metagenome TaxID=1076179 RepID=A0A645HEL0_9ZZZZ